MSETHKLISEQRRKAGISYHGKDLRKFIEPHIKQQVLELKTLKPSVIAKKVNLSVYLIKRILKEGKL